MAVIFLSGMLLGSTLGLGGIRKRVSQIEAHRNSLSSEKIQEMWVTIEKLGRDVGGLFGLSLLSGGAVPTLTHEFIITGHFDLGELLQALRRPHSFPVLSRCG